MKREANTLDEVDRLIYEKSNTYRIHADNLRWILLGGYAAFFGATIQNAQDKPTIGFLLFFVSILYLLILAVQNWFYNLFAQFVKECEHRIVNNERLRPLEDFAEEVRGTVSPFHPAFFWALLITILGSIAFLHVAFRWSFIITLIIGAVVLRLFHALFKEWNTRMFPLIRKYSNLYKQEEK